jgi:C-terminal processing protease CtpA/Prc
MDLLKKILLLFIVLGLTTVSCVDVPEPGPDDENPKAPNQTIAVNEFVEAVMTNVYLWYSTVPDIDVRYEFDTKAYFQKLLNAEDKWSFVTDDVKKFEDSVKGKETSFGWSLAFGTFSDTKTIFALVEFVYPNTPADKAGVKRGDMIYQMNGADITQSNYLDLLYSANLSFTSGQYSNSGISNVKTSSITALELDLNPVQFTNIIEHGGHKIGYLFYAQYIDNYNSSIDAALQYFLDNQVTDIVLDLRYNPGGTSTAAQHVCSSLAPVNVVNEKKPLVKFQWNDIYQKLFEQSSNPLDKKQLGINFVDTVPIKLGLTKLYIITGQGTASASELTITGLKPYMSVITIGETTYGKYTASITIKPEQIYKNPFDYKDFENWAVQPIVSKYANSQGITDFKNGFVADVPVEDDLLSPIPLGDKNEALLKTALKEITGVEIIAMKSAKVDREYTIFDRGFSRFDANKRELLIQGFEDSMFE